MTIGWQRPEVVTVSARTQGSPAPTGRPPAAMPPVEDERGLPGMLPVTGAPLDVAGRTGAALVLAGAACSWWSARLRRVRVQG